MAQAMESDGVMMLVCEWFAGCTNGTLLVVDHPVLGQVPTCGRCINKMDIPTSKIHAVEIG